MIVDYASPNDVWLIDEKKQYQLVKYVCVVPFKIRDALGKNVCT